MGVPAAITERTYENFIFDAGLVCKNYDPSAPLSEQKANWMGATSGGGSFNAKATIISPKIDGIPESSAVKGAERIAGWAAGIKANFCQIGAGLILDQLPGASIDLVDAIEGYDRIIPGDMSSVDYADNIALIVTHSAAGENAAPEGAVFIIKNPRGSGEFNLDFKPLDNSVMPADFVATYDGENMDDPIWEILMPRGTHTIS